MPSDALKAKYTKRLNDLISEGEAFSKSWLTAGVDSEKWIAWAGSVANVALNIGKIDQAFANQFRELSMTKNPTEFIHRNGMGRLRTIKAEFDAGMFDQQTLLIHAELATDYIEQAEFLWDSGFFVAAVVVTGAVLEDALRTLATGNGIATTSSNGKKLTIEPLNIAIAKAGVYTLTKQKQITAWADLRNNAAHGNSPAPTRDEAKQMIAGVTSFLADYLK